MACGERPRDVRIRNANLIWQKRIESKASRKRWKLLDESQSRFGRNREPGTENVDCHSKRLSGFRRAVSGGLRCRRNMEAPVFPPRLLPRLSRSFLRQMLL